MLDPPGEALPAGDRTRSVRAIRATSGLPAGEGLWLVPRELLVQRLLRVSAGGVGLIVAPPGYGGHTSSSTTVGVAT